MPTVSEPARNPLQTSEALDRFLAGIERRAFRTAELATRSRDDALDVVQDAMLALVRNYADRPEAEWRALFHRILQSRIRDFGRRSSIRSRFRAWLGSAEDGDDEENPIDQVADPLGAGPAELAEDTAAGAAMVNAIRELPLRQQQAFVLRAWEGLDVAETAAAMECSEGSVKTHYFRALETLRSRLEGEWR